MIYMIIAFVLLLLSYHYDFCDNGKNKKKWYVGILIVLILLSGLRYRLGVDTTRYCYRFYHSVPYLWQLKWEDFAFGRDPLYMLFNSLVLSLGGKFYVVQLIHAAFVNGLLFKYIQKHSSYIFTCVFFYFIWKFFAYNMEEMRASISVVICLFANDYILEKKWIKGIFLYIIGCFFHASTVIVIMMIPLLFFFKMNIKGLVLLLGAYIVGGILMAIIEDHIAMLEFSETMSNKAEGYFSRDDLTEQLGNVFYFIVNIVPFLLYSTVSLLYVKHRKKDIQLLKLEPLLMIALLFLIIQMQIYIFYRFVNFYAIYIILFSSYFLVNIAKNNRRLDQGVSYFRSLAVSTILIFAIIYPYFREVSYGRRFYPYSSVIEKSINRERELIYSEMDGERMHPNEY